MEIFLLVIHIVVSLFLVLVVLLQSGRGGGMGAALGGASGQIFGGRGAGNFLTRLTTWCAVIFFVTSLSLSMMSSRHRSVMHGMKAPVDDPNAPSDTAEADKKPAEGSKGEPAAKGGIPAGNPTGQEVQPGAAGDGATAPAKNPEAPAATPPGVPGP